MSCWFGEFSVPLAYLHTPTLYSGLMSPGASSPSPIGKTLLLVFCFREGHTLVWLCFINLGQWVLDLSWRNIWLDAPQACPDIWRKLSKIRKFKQCCRQFLGSWPWDLWSRATRHYHFAQCFIVAVCLFFFNFLLLLSNWSTLLQVLSDINNQLGRKMLLRSESGLKV